jgi:hypothetical protein
MSIDSPWTTDTRVRDRNIKKGLLEPKELEKFLKDLPDAADKCEIVTIAQPAIGDGDEDDDDDDDDDDTDE